jgi:hypothetical protein
MSEQTSTTENTPKVFRIVPEKLDSLQAKLAKLNKTAAKLGSEPIVLTILGEVMVKSNDEEGDKARYEKRIEATVVGVAPKLNGWAIAAVIEHTEAGNILRAVPPYTPEAFNQEFRTSAATCDHCGYDRRRKDTYIVRHDDGRQNQVGRTCLKDFTGHASPEGIATWAGIISCLEDLVGGFCGGGSGQTYFNLIEVLQTAGCAIRRDGFMSKKRAQEVFIEKNGEWMPTTTSQTVSWLFSPIDSRLSAKDRAEEQARRDAYTVQDADKAIAELAQEWAATQNPTVDQDYLWNLRVVANMGEITYRNFGLAVSMISAYQRAVDKLAGIERERKVRPVSQFVSEIGKREDFTLTLKKIMNFDGRFGTTSLHIFVDANGNTLTWWKSGYSDMEETHTYVIKGTVKEHEVYSRTKDEDGLPVNGTKQTVLTRCKILKEIEDAADASVMNVFA